MESDGGKDHAFFPDALHQLRGEVEPGRGSGSGTRFPAIDRLIPVRVGKVLFDVVGQGHFPQLFQNFQEDAFIVERDDPVARFQHLVDGGGEPAVAKGDVGSLFQPAAGIDDALPAAVSQVFQKQHFHGAAGAGFLPIEPGRDDFGVIDHQTVALLEVIDDVIKMLVLHLAGLFVQHHQPGGVPLLQGSLGDQFFGKVVIKITFFHNSYAAGPTCTPVK